ncbi:hypothetical protein ACFZBP_18335 [Streptomyces sp. NPDC008086]|uniref:hypothetical protein n=1 Tax=Streptomyces sp. NPDC008086 TaxID=3364807 RepID=UPI0036E566FE
MLVSLTVVGAARQSFTKTLAVTGADAEAVVASAWPPAAPPGLMASVEADPRHPGLVRVTQEGLWLGSPVARDEAFGYLLARLRSLADAAQRLGGVLHAPGVSLGPSSPPAAGDTHTLYVTDAAEQEVLVNLLRRYSPALIALCGRGTVGPQPDRVGSRWLTDSREHLTTRYLASADPRHLEHVRADIRRRDGIADLTRMDVAPVPETDDRPAGVLVRCIDAQLSVTDLRAQALLLAALALYARRKVRAGNREGNIPQAVLEKNRARAVTQGLRARFLPEGDRAARAADTVPARESVRRLLDELLLPLGRLEAVPEELVPLLVPVEGPDTGLPPTRSQDVLTAAARRGPNELAAQAELLLFDARPGGLLLESLRRDAPGRVELLLGSWARRLARAEDTRRSGSGGGRRKGGDTRGDKRGDKRGEKAARGGSDRAGASGNHGRRSGRPDRTGQDQRGNPRRNRGDQDRGRDRRGGQRTRGGSGDAGTTARDSRRGREPGGPAGPEPGTPRGGMSDT